MLLLCLSLLVACGDKDDEPTDSNVEADADADADADSDSDADSDADSDSDSDADSDADADADSDADTDSDTDTDTGGPKDSDGDGWTDAEEAASYTDPYDASDHPYTGGWEIDSCRSSITSTGSAVGDIAADFSLPDQYGDNVSLHDFCDKVVLLDFGTQWCGTCKSKASTVAGWQAKYESYGFIAITAHSENTSYSTPSTSDLLAWDTAYSSGHPVVADASGTTDKIYDPSSTSRPTYVLIGPGVEIMSIGGSGSVTGSDIEAILPTSYP